MKQLKFYLLREKIISLIRDFFIKQKFHEVITPVLNDAIPFEPNIYPFETEWKNLNGTRKLFLSTSPEKNLKKLLAAGMGNCFSIGHSFRNLEASGPLHTPEFLMLEWYRKNADYTAIMKDVQNLIIYIGKQVKESHYNVLKHYNIISLIALFKQYAKLDLEEIVLSDEKLFAYARKKGHQTKGASWHELFDQIFVNEIEPYLPKQPCFLIDFPSRISPLCKPKKDKPYLAERFELYINKVELANGNTENTDVESVKKGLLKPIDQKFLQSLKMMDKTSYAGVGLGIDRLTMIFSNSSYIKFD